MHSTWDVLLKLHEYVLATQSSLQGVMLIGANFDSILEIGPKVGGWALLRKSMVHRNVHYMQKYVTGSEKRDHLALFHRFF